MPGIQIEVERGGWIEAGELGYPAKAPMLECAWQGTGAALITHERARQKEVEGYNECDDEYTNAELPQAACAYIRLACPGLSEYPARELWPWPYACFRPNDDPIRALTKAGALIAAEIDRLLALENGQAETETGQSPSATTIEF